MISPSEGVSREKLDSYKRKFEKCSQGAVILESFTDFLNEERWDATFNCSMKLWLDQSASANMRIFLGQARAQDLLVKTPKMKKGKILNEVRDEEMN